MPFDKLRANGVGIPFDELRANGVGMPFDELRVNGWCELSFPGLTGESMDAWVRPKEHTKRLKPEDGCLPAACQADLERPVARFVPACHADLIRVGHAGVTDPRAQSVTAARGPGQRAVAVGQENAAFLRVGDVGQGGVGLGQVRLLATAQQQPQFRAGGAGGLVLKHCPRLAVETFIAAVAGAGGAAQVGPGGFQLQAGAPLT